MEPQMNTNEHRSRDSPPRRKILEVIEEIHAAQRARGYVGRTREEIDAEIHQMRAEWDDHQ